MCASCRDLGEENRRRVGVKSLRQLRHTNKGEPHCEYPATCTCRHQPVGEYVDPKKVKR